MSVFISWSGPRSHRVASALREWLEMVIQASKPWLSSADIARGAEWRSHIRRRLNEARAGIICLTPENLSEPWLLFEAGALSSRVEEEAHVCTYLFELEPSAVPDPLGQYQATKANEEETKQLVLSVNRAINRGLDDTNQTPDKLVENVFERLWPDLEKVLNAVPPDLPMKTVPKRTTDEMVAETLDLVRQMARPPAPSSVEPVTFQRFLDSELSVSQQRTQLERLQESLLRIEEAQRLRDLEADPEDLDAG